MSLNQQFKRVTFSLTGILYTSMLPCTKFLLCLGMDVFLKVRNICGLGTKPFNTNLLFNQFFFYLTTTSGNMKPNSVVAQKVFHKLKLRLIKI